ncbi:hypothetical protein [Candidatus Solincola tengchongensis]|uniref:hypothetical protein n=1 Tax=Candidatus Solincola tengchongensis TaxID=2900693 RepID=UPI00257F6BEB|nr:hypothetical protein [Candidatus Solincola tengchongensis]
MRRHFFIAAAVVLALLAGTVSVLAQGDRSAIEAVLHQVEGLRGLSADPDVPVDYLTQDQLRKRMIEDFEEENPEEEIRTASEIMAMLGFVEPGLDLYKLYIDLYTEQIAGFYDPEEKRMFLISEDQDMGPMDRYVLAHELTHYLQDVNFNLRRPPFYDPPESEEGTDDDASFAATCLVEGDAMLTSQLWLYRYMDASEMLEMQQESGEFSTEVLDSAPEYVRDGLLFPYEEGMEFVRFLQKTGGFDRVDAAFQHPPKSTEQIYHPEKYLSGDDPIPLELPDLSAELGEGWELAYDDVLGEFDVFELFKPFMSKSAAEEAAAGWGGNDYHYYRDSVGEKLLVQLYAWDSEEDASEFIAAYVEYLEKRFKAGLREGEARGAWKTWGGGGYVHALKKEGKNVYVLQASDEQTLEVALAGLGESGEELRGEELGGELAGEEEGGGKNIRDYGWLVIAGVAGLFFLGIVLIIVMFVLMRGQARTQTPPPPGAYGPGLYPSSPHVPPPVSGRAEPAPPVSPPRDMPEQPPPPGGPAGPFGPPGPTGPASPTGGPSQPPIQPPGGTGA